MLCNMDDAAVTTTLEQLKLRVEIVAIIVTMLGAIGAGAYALMQYVENARAARAKETLHFVEVSVRDSLSSSRVYIDGVIEAMQGQKDNKANSILETKDEHVYKKHITDSLNGRDVIRNLNAIFEFYDQLYSCNAVYLCDEDISLRFFGKYAYDLIGVIYPFVMEKRIEYHDGKYAEGIIHYFESYKVNRKGGQTK